MSDKKTNVILTNYQLSAWAPTKIKIGKWTEAQKQEFLNNINTHSDEPYYNGHCAFSVHFDKTVVHVCSSRKPKTFMPIRPKNKKNELIIEIIPHGYLDNDCRAALDSTCPLCIQKGLCDLPLIREYIGQTLFSKKYVNQK